MVGSCCTFSSMAINHRNNLPQDVVDHLKSLNQDCIFTKEIPSLKQKICI